MHFDLKEKDFIQLCDLLKVTNLCQTGGHAKIVISNGEVKVDGKVETRKRCKIRVGQRVEFMDEIIEITSTPDPSS